MPQEGVKEIAHWDFLLFNKIILGFLSTYFARFEQP